MKTKNRRSLSSKFWLIILVIICGILLGSSYVADRAQQTGIDARGPLGFIASYTIIPMQNGLNKIGTWVGDLSDNFATLEEMRTENQKLKEENDNLIITNNQLQQNTVELSRFYELYKMDAQTAEYEKVGARVIGSNGTNWFRTITINKGSNDGLRVDMNVLAGSGLVGIITEVGPNWSTVRTLIDGSSNVSGMVLSTFDICMVTGDPKLINEGVIRFTQLANNENDVPVGEQIVTSHISNKFLQGLLIGHFAEVEVDANNLTRSGYIIPAVDFRKLQEVLVITTTKQDLVNKKNEAKQEVAPEDTALDDEDVESTNEEQP